MTPSAFACRCGWEGLAPSYTERKDIVTNDGAARVVRWHEPICPRCFEPAQTVAQRTDHKETRP